MSSEHDPIEFFQRTVVALQAGHPLPPEVSNVWLNAITACLVTPGLSLDDALGIQPGPGQTTIATRFWLRERARLFHAHYHNHYANESITAASLDMEINLRALERNPSDRNVPQRFKTLYEDLSTLRLKIPSARTIYNEIRYFVTNRF